MYFEINDPNGIWELVASELDRATKKFGTFHSTHEGFAIIKEELDEMWDEIKKNNITRSREEAIQVAAMALRYLMDIK